MGLVILQQLSSQQLRQALQHVFRGPCLRPGPFVQQLRIDSHIFRQLLPSAENIRGTSESTSVEFGYHRIRIRYVTPALRLLFNDAISRGANATALKLDESQPSRRLGTAFARAVDVSTKRDVRLTVDVELRGQPYVLTVTADSFKLARKGRRDEIELPWTAFLDEDAAMMSALHASMRKRGRLEK